MMKKKDNKDANKAKTLENSPRHEDVFAKFARNSLATNME